jgi:hypothetical protein
MPGLEATSCRGEWVLSVRSQFLATIPDYLETSFWVRRASKF